MRTIGKIILVIVFLIAVGVTIAYGLLQTGWGRHEVEKILASHDVVITGLSANPPFSLHAATLTLKDAQGVWLEADGVTLQWGLGLFPLDIHIHRLAADRMQLQRLPEPSGQKGAALPRLEVQQLSLPRIDIAPAVAGRHMQMAVNGHVDVAPSGIAFALKGAAEQVENLPQALTRLASGPAAFSLKGTWRDKTLLLNAASLRGAHATLEGQDLRLADQTLAGSLRLSVPEMHYLDPQARGALTAQALLGGTLSQPQAQVNATLQGEGRELKLAALIAKENGLLRVTQLSAQTRGLELKGNVDYDLKMKLADGHVHVNATDLSGLDPFVAEPVQGTGEMDIALTGAHGRQGVNATASLHNASYGQNSVAQLHLEVKAADIAALEGITASATASGLHAGNSVIDTLSLHASGDRHRMQVTLAGQADGDHPWKGHAAGMLEAQWPDWKLSLKGLQGEYDHHPVALAAPATVSSDNGAITVSPLKLKVASGTIEAKGGYSVQDSNLHLTFSRIPLALLSEGRQQGLVSGTVHVTGPAVSPKATLDLQASGLTSALRPKKGFSLEAKGTLSQDNLSLKVQTTHSKEHFSTEIHAPAKFSLSPFHLELPPEGALHGSLHMDAELGPALAMVLPPEQELSGHTQGTLTLGGTLANPSVSGTVTLKDGRYENHTTGTVLTHMNVTLRARGDRLEIVQGTAKAGDGKAVVEGSIGLRPPYPVSLQVKLAEADIINMAEATGTANGELRLSGDAQSLLIRGDITLGPMEIRLPTQEKTKIPKVKILNPSVLPAQVWQKKQKGHGNLPLSQVRLDIKIRAPSDVFARGRGLDTELRGVITITGTAEKPQVEGLLKSVHGTYTLLDHQLTISEGTLNFHGDIPPSPFMKLVATTTTKDLTANVTIEGAIRSPQIILTSTPPRPEDEILAYLLFGRDVRSITPVQGIQLAQAIQTLRGKGGGPDFLGTARDLLGLSNLNVGQSASGSAEVSAGKNIGSNIYLGAEAGQEPGSEKATATFEISPHFSVETEAGSDTRGVRLNWKRDY